MGNSKNLVGLYCLQPIRNCRKAGNPTALLSDVAKNPMLPLSFLGLRPISRGASSFQNI